MRHIQRSEYLAAWTPDQKLNRRLLDKLGRNFCLGDWVGFTRSVTAVQKRSSFHALVSEMADDY